MLTDSLAVVPNYVLDSGLETSVACRLPGLEAVVRARVEYWPDTPADALPALIRLEAPFQGRAQTLSIVSPSPNEPLLLLHYPMSVPDLQLSQGHLVTFDLADLTHDAESASGSGGAPVLSAATGHVLGIHWGRRDYGFGVPLAAVLETLRPSAVWREIADFHRLADVGPTILASSPVPPPSASPPAWTIAPSGPPDHVLLQAAMSWTFDPEALTSDDRERLQMLVGDPDEPRWSLPTDERQRLIASAGSLGALRAAHVPATDHSPAERTVDRIIAGPPFDLAEVPDEDLPYWLQAVPWFASVVPGLPLAAQVHRELQARRVRGRLRAVATPKLWGREAELDLLQRWYHDADPAPMLLTGIGGMGKSALVARFALDLPNESVILWLDFDRPDLAPDNAVSVLSALAEQLAVQHDGPATPPVDEANWPAVAKDLGTALGATTALLVLDGFEVAQHAQRHDELWEVLDLVLASAQGTRVLVSGRAPVPGLRLGGRMAKTMPLTGLPTVSARDWLLAGGIDTPDVLDSVMGVADGIPLLLKLAIRLAEAGGDVADVPRSLPRELVSGFLYQRILDRVIDRRLRYLGHDALVLRRITRDVLVAVLSDRIPSDLDPDEAISQLMREFALVETLDASEASAVALRLRPEVRAATLRLLEVEDSERVRLIDRRAADWYSGPGSAADGEPEARIAAAAEAVYHHIRLGDIDSASAVWVEGCAPLLAGADEDVPERFTAARDWLRSRVADGGGAESRADELRAWEASALVRIRNALARGLDRSVRSILSERPDRSPNSPLLVYDAWMRRTQGDLREARRLLRDAADVPGPIGTARTIVAARTAVLDQDINEADRLLADVDMETPIQLLTDPSIETPIRGPDQALVLTAARIRFAIDLNCEVSLLHALRNGVNAEERAELNSILVPWDFVLPTLRARFGRGANVTLPPIPESPEQDEEFAKHLDERREKVLRQSVPPRWRIAEPGYLGPLPPPGDPEDIVGLGHRLADLSARRWRLGARGTFLTAARRSIERRRYAGQLWLSLAGTLAAYQQDGLQFHDGSPLSACIEHAARRTGDSWAEPDSLDRMRETQRLLQSVARRDPKLGLDPTLSSFEGTGPFLWDSLRSDGWVSGANSLLLLAFGPEPLEELERRVLGRPELKAK
jgi:hypothetical protein